MKNALIFCMLAGLHFAAAPSRAETTNLDLGGGVELELTKIPQGQFLMGSPESEEGRNADEKQHRVTLTRDFYLSRTVVTVAQWQRFTSETRYRTEAESGASGGFGWDGKALAQRKEFSWKNPGFPQTPGSPAVIVSWVDTQPFLQWLSKKTKWSFELPTEAQWEYACRAESTTAWWMSGDPGAAKRGLWILENSGSQTHPAAGRPANPWSLHIAGNVWEWCADWYGPYESLTTSDPLQRTAPATEKPRRVLRGGSWLRPLKDARSAARYRNDPQSRNADNSFRVMSYGPPAASPVPVPIPQKVEVEVEPGTPPRREAPAESIPREPPVPRPDAAAGQPATPRGRGSWLIWLGLLGIGAWLLRRIFRPSISTPPVPANRMNPPPPPLEMEVPPLSGGVYATRPVEDGFWLNAGLAAGTWLNLTWRDNQGFQREKRVQYEPGPEGHFIYTGSTPEQVQVTSGEASMQDSFPLASEAVLPPPMPIPPAPPRTSQDRYRPSAY